ncbi:Fe3+-hydroxamate ABC transporter substrate-binding protein [Halogeometricum borinquense DSM 11551]|uniref:ABC-type Fe3+-hydroxamate transport system, periplasmic component n=1 Tax=Halogeometricum borinquense (strain ATCC 700274 / DSM 11551 / JCM 10706 / KCTC 4070 / PR3) TaxID=469382 RepID=E4NVJ9_HALBP|nr:ABC transporter substrate-binding protein [Halogeometricum borinquense]ADQ68883.1 ABC-type Fe3+-hydroxamate transport system, periplasmic component [Halogeometricum borinquense DSM 11551]ELY28988.1 Fe3+-hydroxamate ABC transporter substrate-binding protein [Halogeometricum borinquense DSM 11551]
MERDSNFGQSRRRFLRTGAGIAVSGALAGCAGQDSSSPTTSEPDTEGTAETSTAEATETSRETAETDDSYTVSMEPVGTVEFDEVPESWFSYTADYADMGVALGQGDGLSAIGVRARFGTHLYEELSGVSVDKADLTQLWQDGTGKEVFYELDADVHLIDPNFMVNRLQWSQEDIDEIDSNVAPFFGNTIFTRAYDWHDYADYTLYEAFEKVADVFQAQDRFEAFETYHNEVIADVQSRLPDETPDIAILYPADVPPESFYPYLVGSGSQSKHWNDLHVGDALANQDITDAQAGGTIDYETLLEIDPDALAIRLQGEITPEYFEENIVSHLKNHDVASQLRAVQNDRVVYGGLTYQGPIIHLFQLERAAQGLYPDEFAGEQLFDRKRVSDIVNGDF